MLEQVILRAFPPARLAALKVLRFRKLATHFDLSALLSRLKALDQEVEQTSPNAL